MRIGLDIRYSGDHFPGIGRYTVSLVRALAEQPHGHTLVLIFGPQIRGSRYEPESLALLPGVEVVKIAVGPFSPLQQATLPSLARRLRLDLLHSPYYVKPYVGLPCPSVVTIYDLIGRRFPDLLSSRGRLFYRVAMGLAVRTASALITTSQSARDDLTRVYGHTRAPITVTPLAADERFHPQPAEAIATVRQRYGLPERYVLYVGSNKPHKNVARLVQAWAQTETQEVQLVIAGHEDPKYVGARQLVAQHGLSKDVCPLPSIADADLPALYSGALLFAYPSYYEGFGLPPLEAMACGTPVLCAAVSSLPEVVGDAALTVDPFDPAAIAEGLAHLLHNPALRHELGTQGLRQAREFSWRRTALATLRVYEQVVGR